MNKPTKAPFPFPLTAEDIAAFCHPDPASGLSQPHFIGGDLHAGNGHIAIRARTGRWMESDFAPPAYEFQERFANLPWHRIPEPGTWWKALDDIRGPIYATAPIAPFLRGKDGRITRTPSPVWEIGGHHLIRLSHLQLIARLPKAIIYTGPAASYEPIFIRYNNGTVILPKDKTLTTSSRKIFPPTYHALQGHRNEPTSRPAPSWGTPPPPEPEIEGWPPQDTTDCP